MREQPADDTTEGPDGARGEGERGREPGSYYYDDGTGYEVFDPSEEDREDESEEAGHVEKP